MQPAVPRAARRRQSGDDSGREWRGRLRRSPHRGRVVTTHHALLARELDDGVGHQVGLAQVSGASGVGGQVGAQMGLAGDGERELLNTLGLGEHAAELLLEGDLGQTLAELVEEIFRSSS